MRQNNQNLNFILKELIEWHQPRVKCLIEANCDLIAFETIPSIKEALAVISLLSKYPAASAWLSFSCKVSYLE